MVLSFRFTLFSLLLLPFGIKSATIFKPCEKTSMPLTEPDLWISHIRLFGLTHRTPDSIKLMHYSWSRQRVMFEVLCEFSPVHLSFLATPVEPFLYQSDCQSVKPGDTRIVPADSIVLKMASQLGCQNLPPVFCPGLASYWLQPFFHLSAFRGEFLTTRLARRYSTSSKWARLVNLNVRSRRAWPDMSGNFIHVFPISVYCISDNHRSALYRWPLRVPCTIWCMAQQTLLCLRLYYESVRLPKRHTASSPFQLLGSFC